MPCVVVRRARLAPRLERVLPGSRAVAAPVLASDYDFLFVVFLADVPASRSVPEASR